MEMVRSQELGMKAVNNVEEATKRKTYWSEVCDFARESPGQWYVIDRDDLSKTTVSTMVGRINSGRYGKGVKSMSRDGKLYIQGGTE